MTQTSNRRPAAFALAALLTVLPFASGCARYSAAATDPSDAPSAPTGSANGILSSVDFAKAQLGGATPETPAQSQQALLAKDSLTHEDFESAMRARAACIEQRVPGTNVELYPGSVQPQMFDLSVEYVAPEAPAKPLSSRAQERALAQCQLPYSAYVQDRRQTQQPPALDDPDPAPSVAIRVRS